MSATVAKSPTEDLRRQLASLGTELKNALPSHITPEKFQRVVMTVVNLNPDLMQGDRRTLLGACMKCAADGLIPDGREAALVIYNTNVAKRGEPAKWVKAVQYMPMVAGLLKRARNSGEISTISANIIYANDDFLIELGDDEKIVHKPAWARDRGQMIGVYAIAKLKDGGIQRAILSADDVARIRGASKTAESGPWKSWPEEMWKKSAIRRLTKYLPMDADVDAIMRRDDEAGAPTTIEQDGSRSPGHDTGQPIHNSAPASRMDALESTFAPGDEGQTIDGETGEIIDGQVEPEPAEEVKPEPKQEPKAGKAATTKADPQVIWTEKTEKAIAACSTQDELTELSGAMIETRLALPADLDKRINDAIITAQRRLNPPA